MHKAPLTPAVIYGLVAQLDLRKRFRLGGMQVNRELVRFQVIGGQGTQFVP